MNKIIVVATALVSGAVWAAGEVAPAGAKALTPEQRKALAGRATSPESKSGGFVVQPGSEKGAIGFLNAQTRFPATEIEKVMSTMKQLVRHRMEIKQVAKPAALPTRADVEAAGVTVAVFAVDDPNLPILLSAPEDRWALVNVAKLGEGLKDDPASKALLAGRFRGELQRAFALACGGWASQHKGNLSVVSDVKGIDKLDPDALMGDLVPRYINYLPQIGVTPGRRLLYRLACLEGWAPVPVTDSQKKIWNDVHALPANPIVIEPEKKTPAK